MNSEKLASIFGAVTFLVLTAGLMAHVLFVFFRERKELQQRLARAKQRRDVNERLAQELYIEVMAQERARNIVAAQRQDTTPISVPVTACDRIQRRRILRSE